MKKLYSLILCTLFSLSAASIETVDYTQGLSVWFDTPNNLDGQAIWLRANGTGANPDKAWESRSLPIGNGRPVRRAKSDWRSYIRRTNHTK